MKLILLFFIASAVWLITADSAFAHDRVEVGPYVVIIGWENEPPIVGDRNFLVIDITRDGEPVEEVEASMNLQVVYGGRTFTSNINPTSTPGRYKVDMYPTVRGQYIVEFRGMIEETEANFDAEPEEVLPASALQFPEVIPETAELETEIAELATQLETARLLAIAGIVIGVVGLAVGVVGLIRRR